jgi:uncharacterized protein YbaR (Trm112 family)
MPTSLTRALRSPFRATAPSRRPLGAAWAALLRCPTCQTRLTERRNRLRCEKGHRFPIVDGVPVFTEAGTDVERRPNDHASHQAPAEMVAVFDDAPGPWLHLGAGATDPALPGSIELETAVFRNTDVVGDVHHLPFADGVLGGVLALNVFEHLADPERAAAELHRCLLPGSPIIIGTAFLQPLHADPYHFYNTTEAGLRRWFRDFDVERVDVPWHFNPVFAVAWFASDLLGGVDEPDRAVLGAATLAELAEIWRGDDARTGPVFDAFQRLPDHLRRTLAAGYELRARR